MRATSYDLFLKYLGRHHFPYIRERRECTTLLHNLGIFLHIRDVVTNLVVVVVDAPFLCLTAPPPPARGEEPVRGEPAPTFVLLAAGPTRLRIIIKIEGKNWNK